MLLAALLGWLEREQCDVIAFLGKRIGRSRRSWVPDGYGCTMTSVDGLQCSGSDSDVACCD
jgi:hypothetical protein